MHRQRAHNYYTPKPIRQATHQNRFAPGTAPHLVRLLLLLQLALLLVWSGQPAAAKMHLLLLWQRLQPKVWQANSSSPACLLRNKSLRHTQT
jgi:hypothetical protein